MKIKFEPRDIWVGLYWCESEFHQGQLVNYFTYKFYLCVVPCFPIIWTWTITKQKP